MRAFCKRCKVFMEDGLITWKSRIFRCPECGHEIRIDFNPQGSEPLKNCQKSETQ